MGKVIWLSYCSLWNETKTKPTKQNQPNETNQMKPTKWKMLSNPFLPWENVLPFKFPVTLLILVPLVADASNVALKLFVCLNVFYLLFEHRVELMFPWGSILRTFSTRFTLFFLQQWLALVSYIPTFIRTSALQLTFLSISSAFTVNFEHLWSFAKAYDLQYHWLAPMTGLVAQPNTIQCINSLKGFSELI